MKQFIDKLIERLEAIEEHCLDMHDWQGQSAIVEAKEIVNQLAEEYSVSAKNAHTGGWIPCEKELPPQPKGNVIFEGKPLELYLVSLKNADYPLRAFWNGKYFTDGWCKLEVTAWQPLPTPYQPKGE